MFNSAVDGVVVGCVKLMCSMCALPSGARARPDQDPLALVWFCLGCPATCVYACACIRDVYDRYIRLQSRINAFGPLLLSSYLYTISRNRIPFHTVHGIPFRNRSSAGPHFYVTYTHTQAERATHWTPNSLVSKLEINTHTHTINSCLAITTTTNKPRSDEHR